MTKYIENCEGCGVKMVNEVRMKLCPHCDHVRRTQSEADGCMTVLGILIIYVVVMYFLQYLMLKCLLATLKWFPGSR